jgi:hypothetical protein
MRSVFTNMSLHLGVKFAPRGEVCPPGVKFAPPGVKFAPRGEVCPRG